MDLTARQYSIVFGSLLGDGAMRCKKNALLEINHCAAQRAYVDWKFAELRTLVRTAPSARPSNGKRTAYRFTTLSLESLTPLFRLFYSDARKGVPHGLDLTDLALAVWFMDDGSRSRAAVYLNTQQFGMESQQRLRRILEDRFEIRTTLNRDKEYFRLRVAVESMRKFHDLVRPHVIPEMLYKLPPLRSHR